MLCISMLEHTFRTKHLLIILAIKLNFFIAMSITILHCIILGCSTPGGGAIRATHWKGSKDSIVHWEIFSRRDMMGYLVERAFYNSMLIDLAEALETEGVATGQRERLLLRVVVLLETHSAFKY